MIEVEIKAKIENPKKEIEKLDELGAKYSHTERQHDIYFNAPDKDYKKTDEALRIRSIPKNDTEFENILTYKGPKLNNISKTRKEVEVKINSVEKMSEILENLGFKKSSTVDKIRRIFTYKNYTITIDKLKTLGTYMEIEEVVDEKSNIDEICENIMQIFKKLDITDNFERTSYLELLEEKRR